MMRGCVCNGDVGSTVVVEIGNHTSRRINSIDAGYRGKWHRLRSAERAASGSAIEKEGQIARQIVGHDQVGKSIAIEIACGALLRLVAGSHRSRRRQIV